MYFLKLEMFSRSRRLGSVISSTSVLRKFFTVTSEKTHDMCGNLDYMDDIDQYREERVKNNLRSLKLDSFFSCNVKLFSEIC